MNLLLPTITLVNIMAPAQVLGLPAVEVHVVDLHGRQILEATVVTGSGVVRAGKGGVFHLSRPVSGNLKIQVEAPGFEPRTLEVGSDQKLLTVVLFATAQLTVVVEEGAPHTSEGPSSTLARFDILRDPGAGGDPLQATKDLPGVAQTSDRAVLMVRGGLPSEVGFHVDDSPLAHPYHFPGSQNSTYTVVGSGIATKVDFSPGGFGARYGNALSAILAMDLDDPDLQPSGTLAINMAGVGLSTDHKRDRMSLRTSLRVGSPVLLDHLYGQGLAFLNAPVSSDMNLHAQGSLSNGSIWGSTIIAVQDKMSTEVTQGNQFGRMNSANSLAFGNVRWIEPLGQSAILKVTISHEYFHQDWAFNQFSLDQNENRDAIRAEITYSLPRESSVETGIQGGRVRTGNLGQLPINPQDPSAAAVLRPMDSLSTSWTESAYATWRQKVSDRIGFSLGGRVDNYGTPAQRTMDIRGTLSVLLAPGHTLRLGYGTFHQAPEQSQLDPTVGNPGMRVMQASHALAALGSTWGTEAVWTLRLEAYLKRYEDLPVQLPVAPFFDSTGLGSARGVDLYLRRHTALWNVWMSYGHLNTQRKNLDQPVLGPVAMSISNTLVFGSSWTFLNGVDVGFTWRQSSGVPYTPILGGLPQGGGTYSPIWGRPYSDRLLPYQRLDSRLSRYFNPRCIAFLEVNNLLNRNNSSGYAYSPDYSTRTGQATYFAHRMLVGGLIVRW